MAIFFFFNDILVYSHTLTDHLNHLRMVLQTLRDHHFSVKRSKFSFGQSSVEYLGHVVSTKGVSMDTKKVQAMLEWTKPRNVKELRVFFLG